MLQAGRQKPGENSTHVRFTVLAFLCVLSFLTYYDRQCLVRAQPDIDASLGTRRRTNGNHPGAFWLAYALFEIPSGWMGDRIGARFTLTRIVLAWSLFTALTGVATGFYSLLVYRLLFGAGEAGAYPNMAHVQSRWLPKMERALRRRHLVAMRRWGLAFAPLIFGSITRGVESLQASLADASPCCDWFASLPSWRIGFFISGLLGVVWCLAFYPWFRDEPAQKKSVERAELRAHPCTAAARSRRRTAWMPNLGQAVLVAVAVGDRIVLLLRQLRLVVFRQLDAAVSERCAWRDVRRIGMVVSVADVLWRHRLPGGRRIER